jgi:hypothetical protein
VHVETGGTRVKEDQILFDLADAADCRLKHTLDVHALLRVHHLIITLLQLTVDIYVLDVELGQMLEDGIVQPGLYQFNSLLILFCGYMFDFDLS